jgi:hypothetical protein
MTVLYLLKLSSIDYVVILNDFVHMYISISEWMYCSYFHAVFRMFPLLEYSYVYWCLLYHMLSDVYDYMYFVLCNCDYFHILGSCILYGFMEDE